MAKATRSLPKRRTDLAVFIGRFQPLHHAHLHIILTALQAAEHLVLVIGSAKGPRSHHDSFTFQERMNFILACLTEEQAKRVSFIAMGDFHYDDSLWYETVYRDVSRVAEAKFGPHYTIKLIGHQKDGTSFYLKGFPSWGEGINVPSQGKMSATEIRTAYFADKTWIDRAGKDYLPAPMIGQLHHFALSEAYEELVREYRYCLDYKKQYGEGPYLTGDACVLQGAYILLVKRKGRPYKGNWVMPGGFLDLRNHPTETLRDCGLRELVEETEIDVAPAALQGSVIHAETFDLPFRDPRARIVTQTLLINLPTSTTLPRVSPQYSEVEETMWWNIADLREEMMGFDHYHIIRKLRGRLPQQPR